MFLWTCRVIRAAILFCLLSAPVAAQTTLCPTVSDGTSILPVSVTGSPQAAYFGSYDLKTNYLTITYQNGTNKLLIGVPTSLIVGHQTVAWASISRYPSALMQERSPCPLLSSTNSPIIAQ
jgi:hypothetical protein